MTRDTVDGAIYALRAVEKLMDVPTASVCTVHGRDGSRDHKRELDQALSALCSLVYSLNPSRLQR